MIRRAEVQDFWAVMGLLEAMHDENGIGTLDLDKVAAEVERLCDHGVVLIAETAEGVFAGTLALEPQEWWYSKNGFLGDRWFYVHPERRGGGFAARLIQAAHRVADYNGVPLVMGVLSPVEPERKTALFTRAGMKPLGGTFIYDPSEGK